MNMTDMYVPLAAVAIGAGAPPLMVAVCFAIFSNFMWGLQSMPAVLARFTSIRGFSKDLVSIKSISYWLL